PNGVIVAPGAVKCQEPAIPNGGQGYGANVKPTRVLRGGVQHSPGGAVQAGHKDDDNLRGAAYLPPRNEASAAQGRYIGWTKAGHDGNGPGVDEGAVGLQTLGVDGVYDAPGNDVVAAIPGNRRGTGAV